MVLSRGVGHTGNADWSTAPSCGHVVMQSCSPAVRLHRSVLRSFGLEVWKVMDRTTAR